MARTALEYKQLLKSLFPKGRAWNKEQNSVLDQYCYALAEEFKRIEDRQNDLNNESHVLTSTELLSDHENDYGISGDGLSIDERREQLHAVLLSTGGLLPSYYIEVLEAAGYTISITEYTPAWVGVATIGDTVGDQTIIFLFTVNVDINGDCGEFQPAFHNNDFDSRTINDITVFQSRIRSLTDVIEIISEIKPAHMHDRYGYLNAAFDYGFSYDFNSFPSNDDSIPIIQFNHDFDSSFTAQHVYDGDYLIGSFDKNFSPAFDAHFGGAFQNDIFSTDFLRPI
jgi:uncharacterized protein YmfQ (DUF2313 family)